MFEHNKIYLMDCMEGMREFPDQYFELAIVDPPYRNDNENRPTKEMRNTSNRFVKDKFLGKKPTSKYFDELFRVSKNQIIWGANNFFLPDYKGFVIWEKLSIGENFSMSMAELAYISEGLGTTSKIFKCAPQGTKDEPRIHPTQKPIALYRWLLKNYAKPGDKILDTHVGSASSLIACHEYGHDFIGFEIDEGYYSAARERLEAHMAQVSLFDMGG